MYIDTRGTWQKGAWLALLPFSRIISYDESKHHPMNSNVSTGHSVCIVICRKRKPDINKLLVYSVELTVNHQQLIVLWTKPEDVRMSGHKETQLIPTLQWNIQCDGVFLLFVSVMGLVLRRNIWMEIKASLCKGKKKKMYTNTVAFTITRSIW